MNQNQRKTPGMRRILLVLGLLIIFMSQTIYAKGVIRGKVVDERSKDALPYANVMVKGTNIGSPADLNGEFTISNAPSGEQTIVISYIGYETREMIIEVPSNNKALYKEIELKTLALHGETVIVTAQGKGQMQAINQQLASDKITSIVSEARIQELPDFNAAAALGRLPGVSTVESSGEASKVVIRGLAPQYNSVSVEGVKLASTGSSQMGVSALGNTSGSVNNDRSVDLTMISPYMIKAISVYKSLTPDMNANSIGGSVDMVLREAPSELHYDLMWQQGYTAKTGNLGNYRVVGSVSDRFFGDRLGLYALLNAEKYDRDADNMSASYRAVDSQIDTTTGFRPVGVRSVTLNRHIETRKRLGANLIMDYKLPAGSLKAVNMFTRLSSDFMEHQTTLNYFDEILNFNYREGENTTDLQVNSLNFDYDFNWLKMDVKVAHTSSRNELPESPYLQFKTGGLDVITASVPENTIPEDLVALVNYPGADGVYLDNINLFSSLYEETKNTYSTNYKIPYRLGNSITGYLKFGAQMHHQENTNDQATPYASIRKSGDFQSAMVEDLEEQFGIAVDPITAKFTGSSFMGDSKYLKSFLDNEFGEIYWACDPTIPVKMAYYLNDSEEWAGRATGGADQTGGWYNGVFQTAANSYKYTEDYYATYVMSEFRFKDFMIVGGARYEKTKSKYTVYNMFDMRNPEAQDCDTVVAKPSSEFWLPMVQTKYSPVDWMDLRYAYTQSLARPDYHQLSPKVTYDSPRMTVRAGNPNLDPAHAYSHDVNISFHGNKLGLFSIGGFYKVVKEFTYSTSYTLHPESIKDEILTITDFNIMGIRPNDGARLYTYVNSPYDATIKGIEFDLQTRLWYLPKGFDGIVLGINYTMIESKAKYPLYDEVTDYTTRPPVTTTMDTTRTGRLIYQPNDVVNAYVGYEVGGFSARLSFLFQGNSVSYVGAFPEQDGYTKDYFKMDASVRQKLPWFGSEIYLDINNLNNRTNQSAQTSIDGFTSVKHYGMTANVGVRFRL